MSIKDKKLYWTDEEYYDSIQKIKDIALSTTKVYGYDDTTPGNKSTECNHGLCSEKIQPKNSVYRQRTHKCPLDTRVDEDTSSGCFYHCAYFQAGLKRIKKMELPPIKEMVKQFKIK